VAGADVTDLYRFFDSEGTLLYVGISLHAASRASSHRQQGWWGGVARMDVEHLPPDVVPEQVEQAAIIAEHPLHNVTFNPAANPRRIATEHPHVRQMALLRLGSCRCPEPCACRWLRARCPGCWPEPPVLNEDELGPEWEEWWNRPLVAPYQWVLRAKPGAVRLCGDILASYTCESDLHHFTQRGQTLRLVNSGPGVLQVEP
jgi:hypothetical protein